MGEAKIDPLPFLQAPCDWLIIGAGTAGAVLAARLSEDPRFRVLLIEAGGDAPAGAEHPDLLDPYPVSVGNPAFTWSDMIAEVGADLGDGRPRLSRLFLQGRGVGGGSNVQGMAAVRGLPADYDAWAADGAAGWSWTDVLPYFIRLESDLDRSGPLHGTDGPIPIRRNEAADWAPFSRAVGAAALRQGFPPLDDLNAEFGDGLAAMPMANLPDRRVSVSTAYLTAEVRRRPNLDIVDQARALALTFDGRRVTGTEVQLGGAKHVIAAGETILAAGALQSPALLLRSGIGPAATLATLGIAIVADLPGVGANLQNHAEISLVSHLRAASVQSPQHRPWQQNCLRYSSGRPGCPASDMFLVSMNKGGWHPLGRRIGVLSTSVYKPFSTGTVTLHGPDPLVSPAVRFNLLDDERDFDRLDDALALLCTLLSDPEVARTRNQVFLPHGRLVLRLHRRDRKRWLQTLLLAEALRLAPTRALALGPWTIDPAMLLRDAAARRALVRERAAPVHHVAGTCRMGASGDRRAVTDPAGRVHGLAGLRVADASLFPQVPRANTHIPVIMAAEKLADQILHRRRKG